MLPRAEDGGQGLRSPGGAGRHTRVRWGQLRQLLKMASGRSGSQAGRVMPPDSGVVRLEGDHALAGHLPSGRMVGAAWATVESALTVQSFPSGRSRHGHPPGRGRRSR
jgi:hypothetical protein